MPEALLFSRDPDIFTPPGNDGHDWYLIYLSTGNMAWIRDDELDHSLEPGDR